MSDCTRKCRLVKLWAAFETVHLFYAGERAEGMCKDPVLGRWFLGMFRGEQEDG